MKQKIGEGRMVKGEGKCGFTLPSSLFPLLVIVAFQS